MNEIAKYWIDLSNYDFETAIAMMQTGNICMWDLCVTRLLRKF